MKLTGVSAAAGLALTGCGTNARLVERKTYLNMPEYTLPGRSTFFATTCGECPAGCGIVVRTTEGRAIKVEGNPNHPVNKGRTCSRGQTAMHGLYNPDRFQTALRQAERGSGNYEELGWEEGINLVVEALQRENPTDLAFLTGLVPDHLFDLWREISDYFGIPAPLRFSGLAMMEGRNTLREACGTIFGVRSLPHFDIARSDMVFSFGANFTETWISPVSYSLAYGEMRQGDPSRRGYLVQFEPRLSQTAANADEWFPITPGSESLLAGALGALVQERLGIALSPLYQSLDLQEVSQRTGVPVEDIERLARLFVEAEHPLAVPGSVAMAQTNGKQTAEAVLALNGFVDSLGAGGIAFPPESGLSETQGVSASLSEMESFIRRIEAGAVKVLFIHNTNPVFSLPPEMGFMEALAKVPLVISFASYPDETALLSDVVLPDHVALESWGYQNITIGSEVRAVSGFQPVVSPFRDTRATVDVFLAAIQRVGGRMADAIPYPDEVAFIQSKVLPLNSEGGFYAAPEENTFWTLWLQAGGWWQQEQSLQVPAFDPAPLNTQRAWEQAQYLGEDHPFHLLVYPSQNLTDGSGANRPWLQETPDPMTTALWDTWVEINTETAHELGLENDDIVRLITPVGEITAIVYHYPAIRPDVIAVPTGQGHTHFGRFANLIGSNPFKIIPSLQNAAADLAFAAARVRIEKTGLKKTLARKESIPGVYGEDAG